MRSYLDFEKPVAELEAKIDELRALHSDGDAIAEEIDRIESKASLALKELYGGLTPWQKTQVARHPQRPHCLDYIAALITDFVPLATASTAKTPPSSAALAASTATASASSATKRVPIPIAGSSTISAWRGRKVIARRRG